LNVTVLAALAGAALATDGQQSGTDWPTAEKWGWWCVVL